MRLVLLPLLLVALTRCSTPAPPPTPPVQAPRPIPPVAQTPPPQAVSPEWVDWPVSPGDWAYRRDERGSLALFGPRGADADFVVRCAAATRTVFLSRKGAFPAGDSGRMTLRATGGLQSYAVANTDSTPAYVAAETSASDRHLDALIYSRGRFLVSIKGATDLVIPAWAELARVVEDCRG